MVKCTKCGFIYLDFNTNSLNEFLNSYPARYWDTAPSNRFLKVAQKYLLSRKYKHVISCKKKGNLLDVGCGTGDLLVYCQNHGWKVYGQDISPTACKEAAKKINNIYCGRLEDAPYNNKFFDKILLNSVLHQMEKPIKELGTIKKLLKEDGQLILSVPDISSWQFVISKGSWFHLDSPRHLYYFQPESILKLMNIAGFTVKKISYPQEECPLDLFHSLKRYFPKTVWFILLPMTLILKTIPKFRGVMEVIAIPKGKA